MMVIAMMMRPWLVQMKQAAVAPRILADDLQILARGPNRLSHFEFAFDATHKHLYDMGARIAPKKVGGLLSRPEQQDVFEEA